MAPSESTVPETDDMIRACMDAWRQEQQEYASQLAESLASLEAYEGQLQQWHEELTSESDQLDERAREFDERRDEFGKQKATDVAMTAELDQARAEIEDLRERLAEVTDPVVAASAAVDEAVAQSTASNGAKPGAGVELLDPAVSAVAKQFQKLRQQQAARRSAAR